MPVIPIPLLFPIPTDEDDFEDLCVEILRLYWKRPGLERFGRRGEKQFGIDIPDLGGQSPLHAAQCKLREYGKTLSPAAISAEVSDARKFQPPLGKYGILTTAKVPTQAQTRILEINQSHNQASAFEIELLTWDRLCALLQEYDAVREAFYGSIVVTSTSRIGRALSVTVGQTPAAVGQTLQLSISAEIDAARDAIGSHEFQIALLHLNRILERTDVTAITDFERFRISSNLALAQIGLGRNQLAARHFLEAIRWAPDDERARVNEVFAYVLLGENDTAHARAEAL
jgi:cellulose synthase operon protein C